MKVRLLIIIGAFLLTAACGGDEAVDTTLLPAEELTNACPVDGCKITITSVEREGDELKITWDPNFAPEFAKNHIHLYWDTYSAQQVSANAESEYGVEQGNWLPTDAGPTLLTEGAVSVSMRDDSTMLCVTAADFDHVVLDPDLVQCFDVSDSL